MYLPRLNRLWSDYVHDANMQETCAIAITNTTKLRSLKAPSYMVEFEREGRRYHRYHFADERRDELRELNAEYAAVQPQEAFGTSGSVNAASVLSALDAFIAREYDAIQTSVDCTHGVERAMQYIRDIRLTQWSPKS